MAGESRKRTSYVLRMRVLNQNKKDGVVFNYEVVSIKYIAFLSPRQHYSYEFLHMHCSQEC